MAMTGIGKQLPFPYEIRTVKMPKNLPFSTGKIYSRKQPEPVIGFAAANGKVVFFRPFARIYMRVLAVKYIRKGTH